MPELVWILNHTWLHPQFLPVKRSRLAKQTLLLTESPQVTPPSLSPLAIATISPRFWGLDFEARFTFFIHNFRLDAARERALHDCHNPAACTSTSEVWHSQGLASNFPVILLVKLRWTILRGIEGFAGCASWFMIHSVPVLEEDSLRPENRFHSELPAREVLLSWNTHQNTAGLLQESGIEWRPTTEEWYSQIRVFPF